MDDKQLRQLKEALNTEAQLNREKELHFELSIGVNPTRKHLVDLLRVIADDIEKSNRISGGWDYITWRLGYTVLD